MGRFRKRFHLISTQNVKSQFHFIILKQRVPPPIDQLSKLFQNIQIQLLHY